MIPNLDVDQLKTFLAIADTGNFTRASENVNKTQSAVSMQMKRLEETLGRPLFVRDGRGSRITADGERLIEYARRIVAISDEAVAAFTKPDLSGTLRFATPDDYAEAFLPEILARFHATHPRVTVDVECHTSPVLAERIQQGEFDLALVTFNGEDVRGEGLRSSELFWVTSAKHSTHLLDELPVAASNVGCAWRRLVTDALEKSGRKFRIAYSSTNGSALNAAVLRGLAVSALPEMCVRPGMRVLTEAEGFPRLGSFEIGLIYKPGKPSSAAKALGEYVAAGLSSSKIAVAA